MKSGANASETRERESLGKRGKRMLQAKGKESGKGYTNVGLVRGRRVTSRLGKGGGVRHRPWAQIGFEKKKKVELPSGFIPDTVKKGKPSLKEEKGGILRPPHEDERDFFF